MRSNLGKARAAACILHSSPHLVTAKMDCECGISTFNPSASRTSTEWSMLCSLHAIGYRAEGLVRHPRNGRILAFSPGKSALGPTHCWSVRHQVKRESQGCHCTHVIPTVCVQAAAGGAACPPAIGLELKPKWLSLAGGTVVLNGSAGFR